MRLFHRDKKTDAFTAVIIGAGEVGFHIAKRLAGENKQVVVVDRNPDALRRLTEYMDVQTVHGSGSSPMVLDQAGASDADMILAVTDSDEINLIACFFSNVLNPKATKLARIRNEEYTLYRDALSSLNMGMVINPEVEVIKTIDRLLTSPGVQDYNEFAKGKIKMVSVRLNEGPLLNTRLMDLKSKVGNVTFIVAAIVRDEKLIIPTGQDVVKPCDLVYFACEDKDFTSVLHTFGCGAKPIRDVMVIGGGKIGQRFAHLCERRGYHTKLVDPDKQRCEELAEKLSKTIVLHGDGTDKDFLIEENVHHMDVVVSLTGDEETNILSSLLAKNLGAKRTITRINKVAYQPLVRAIGIEHSVSPRISAVNSILHFVRRGKVLSTVTIKNDEAEVLEAIAQEKSDIVSSPVKNLDFPKGALLLAVIRGNEVIIPTGDTVVQPQDRILIISTRQTISKVEQALTVKLEHL